MTIQPVTSVADLLFKAKSSEAYRQLLIKGVREYIYSGRNATTFEEAAFALDRYVSSPFIHSCESIIRDINRFCEEIGSHMEFVVIKNREGEPNLNGRIYLTNPPMTVSATPLEHHHVEPPRRDELLETLTRHAVHPLTSERLTFTSVIPSNASVEYRQMAEDELRRTAERQIDRLRQRGYTGVRNTISWRYRHYENMTAWYGNTAPDVICSEDYPCDVCRECREL